MTEFKIYILGNGDLKREIEDLVENNNLEDRVFITYSPSPIEYLKRTKIFLSLQKDENYPSQSLLEAMATQNAIIATDVGLTRKIVKKEWGLLITNKGELIKSLVNLEHFETCKMGKSAMKFVKENHNVVKFHSYLLSLYKAH